MDKLQSKAYTEANLTWNARAWRDLKRSWQPNLICDSEGRDILDFLERAPRQTKQLLQKNKAAALDAFEHWKSEEGQEPGKLWSRHRHYEDLQILRKYLRNMQQFGLQAATQRDALRLLRDTYVGPVATTELLNDRLLALQDIGRERRNLVSQEPGSVFGGIFEETLGLLEDLRNLATNPQLAGYLLTDDHGRRRRGYTMLGLGTLLGISFFCSVPKLEPHAVMHALYGRRSRKVLR